MGNFGTWVIGDSMTDAVAPLNCGECCPNVRRNLLFACHSLLYQAAHKTCYLQAQASTAEFQTTSSCQLAEESQNSVDKMGGNGSPAHQTLMKL